MGLLVYKISDYRTTHEREQYRILCNHLKNIYENGNEWCIFLANLNIGEIELDGLIIKKDAIICVELKKHGGKIAAYENCHWTANDETILGGSGKTVFEQIRLNRILTKKGLRTETFLNDKQTQDISGIVVFNESIEQLDNKLSSSTKCWLHITDNEHFAEKVQDITTNKLYLELEDCVNLVEQLYIPNDSIDVQYSTISLLSKQANTPTKRNYLATSFDKIIHEYGFPCDTLYLNDLRQIVDPTFDKLYELSWRNLSEENRITPWVGLNHGLKLLDTDNELARYILAYGRMHKEKMDKALTSVPTPQDIFSKPLTIIDWGCGQALATICLLDYFNDINITPLIENIVLIEPSKHALARAVAHISQYGYTQASYINKYINEVSITDLPRIENGMTIHLFSNVLDIESVNIELLHNLIKATIRTEQLFFCVGPQNAGATRIGEFAKLFDVPEENLLSHYQGYLNASRRTINMLVFRVPAIQNDELVAPEIIKVEYQIQRTRQAAQTSYIQRVLSDETPSANLKDKAIQFYRLLVRLEQYKSADVKDNYTYPFEQVESDITKINIDIEQNQEFVKVFQKNHQILWPKNLYIGINFELNDKLYRLLQYVYPYKDICHIDITQNLVSIPLCDFYINQDAADELNITGEVLDVIESILSNPSVTLKELESIVKDAVSGNIKLDTVLQLALTSETLTLNQIKAELDGLANCELSNLLSMFIQGKLDDNIIGHINEEELIHVVDIDPHQRYAIKKALNSRVSVITGPPGTGKTQMILNLLANALVQGKSVLLASKNNKAVDNLKERYERIDNSGYLLRFGSRNIVENQLLPYLNSLVEDILKINFSLEEYKKVTNEYKEASDKIKKSKSELETLIRLQKQINLLTNRQLQLQDELENAYEVYDEKKYKLKTQFASIIKFANNDSWSSIQLQNELLLTELTCPRNFFSKILFKRFKLSSLHKRVLDIYEKLPVEAQEILFKEIKIHVSDIKTLELLTQIVQIIQKYTLQVLSCKKQFRAIEEQHANSIDQIKKNIEHIAKHIAQNTEEYTSLKQSEPKIKDTILNAQKVISSLGPKLFKQCVLAKLKTANALQKITLYKAYLPNNKPWKANEQNTYQNVVSNFIDMFKLNSVTSLSVENSFPLREELFDMVIIDEASQCDVASALPLIQRAKQVVVVGDPLQLKHISTTNIDEEIAIKEWMSLDENPLLKYAKYSLYDYCNDLIMTIAERPIILTSHYRSNYDIIEYSNQMFYQRKLQRRLEVLTQERHPELRELGIKWIDVIGKQLRDDRNINQDEVEKCFDIAQELLNQYPNISIGIISPFKHQVEALKERFRDMDEDRLRVDTVHKFQGDECDVIIYSIVVTDNSPDGKIWWIDQGEPNLVNVAITRARSLVYVVGNKEYVRTHSNNNLPLGYLLTYTEQL